MKPLPSNVVYVGHIETPFCATTLKRLNKTFSNVAEPKDTNYADVAPI